MQAFINTIATQSQEWILLTSAFVVVAAIALLVLVFLFPAWESDRTIRKKFTGKESRAQNSPLLAKKDKLRHSVSLYFERTETRRPNSVEQRLHHAGYFGTNAVSQFYLLRYSAMVTGFLVPLFVLSIFQ